MAFTIIHPWKPGNKVKVPPLFVVHGSSDKDDDTDSLVAYVVIEHGNKVRTVRGTNKQVYRRPDEKQFWSFSFRLRVKDHKSILWVEDTKSGTKQSQELKLEKNENFQRPTDAGLTVIYPTTEDVGLHFVAYGYSENGNYLTDIQVFNEANQSVATGMAQDQPIDNNGYWSANVYCVDEHSNVVLKVRDDADGSGESGEFDIDDAP